MTDDIEIDRWPTPRERPPRVRPTAHRRRERREQRESDPTTPRRDGLGRTPMRAIAPVDGAVERARLIARGLLTPGTDPADGAGLIPFRNTAGEPVLRIDSPSNYHPSRPARSSEVAPRRVL
jgi:hypothetical protein